MAIATKMNERTKQFVLAHADDDVRQLALKGCRDTEVDFPVALQQISGRQAARGKIPSWAAIDDIRYPIHLSMEQCSSEATARYKAQLVTHNCLSYFSAPNSSSGHYRKLVDLTGGFGVDFAFMVKSFDEGIYVEHEEGLCAIVHHNLHVLANSGPTLPMSPIGSGSPIGPINFSVVHAEAEEFLHRMEEHVTLIFVDPARRDKHGARTYSLSDCTPDVLPLMDELLRKSDYVLLKLSPMLDWRKAMADVGSEHVEQVHIVAVDGECKELLLLLSAEGSQQPLLVCSNDDQQEIFALKAGKAPDSASKTNLTGKTSLTSETNTTSTTWGNVSFFLYEPNAALMKGGFFEELAQRYAVRPLAPNSHLFTSDKLVDNFPGRIFRVTAMSTMNKQELKEKVLPLQQANISVRNFPMSVDALRKKLKLSEGGSNYLFATTLADGRHVILICQKK